MTGNQVVLQDTGDVSRAELYGSNEGINGENVKDNSLLIDGWSGTAIGAYNFSSIDMQNISWQSGGSVLTLTGRADDLAGSLADTQINLNSVRFSGGAELQAGDSMTLVTSASGAGLGLTQENVKVSDTFTAGVAAVGAGKIYKLNDANSLDVYGKFFHVYNESDSFTVADDKFAFDSVTSDRLQIGARLTTQERSKWQGYYGLAWEYEFDGEAKMRAQNLSAPTQSLQGSTYIGELGVRYAPGKESPWSVDARVRGYAGEREGFSGSVQATYSF